jgi:hypothetical protein
MRAHLRRPRARRAVDAPRTPLHAYTAPSNSAPADHDPHHQLLAADRASIHHPLHHFRHPFVSSGGILTESVRRAVCAQENASLAFPRLLQISSSGRAASDELVNLRGLLRSLLDRLPALERENREHEHPKLGAEPGELARRQVLVIQPGADLILPLAQLGQRCLERRHQHVTTTLPISATPTRILEIPARMPRPIRRNHPPAATQTPVLTHREPPA